MAVTQVAAPAKANTIRAALRRARATLSASESANLDAQALLTHVLQVERAFLFAHAEYALDAKQTSAFEAMLARRAQGEPIAYITGTKGFYDLEFLVTAAVLIPRPETELLLEEALRLTLSGSNCAVADIGTGCGALALTLARRRPSCNVYATDISAEALAMARQNAESYAAAVHIFCGNLAQPLIDRGIKLDLLMANLPYIGTDELTTLPVSRWEPRLALHGGADGLDLIRGLLRQLPQVCNPGAHILLEIGADQGRAVSQLARGCLAKDITVLTDYAGLDRIVRFRA